MSAERLQGKLKHHAGNIASTEPHSCECGEVGPILAALTNQDRLQRSRTRVSAESTCRCTAQPGGENCFNGAALV